MCMRAYFLLDIILYVYFANVEPFMMSYAEKPEDITREEWMEKLNNVHIQRADMNRLIMNYLVTGRWSTDHLFFSPSVAALIQLSEALYNNLGFCYSFT